MRNAAFKTKSSDSLQSDQEKSRTNTGRKNQAKQQGSNPLWRSLATYVQPNALSIQTKLSVGASDDKFEQQADAVADTVMRMPSKQKISANQVEPLIQSKFDTARSTQITLPDSVQHSIASPGSGSPLDETVRSRIEPVLGSDLSAVRVHQGESAQDASQSLSAKAFTYQNNIYLGKGQSPTDVALMAHESTHVVQQKSAGSVIRRKGLQSELDTELATWAKEKGRSLDPKDKSYAFTLQEYAYQLARQDGSAHPTQKPKKKSEIKQWETDFKKVSLLAKMIMKAGKVEQKETRAGLLGQDLAQVGFIDDAMETAALLTKHEEKSNIYKLVLNNASKAKTEHLITLTKFFTSGKDITDNPIIDKLDGKQGAFAKALGATKLNTMLAILVDAYKSEDKLIEILSEILVFNANLRKEFSKWMWGKDKDFLFKVVDSDYFVEPGYGGSAFQNEKGETHEVDMKKDMPWVYEVKQKYYVDYLVGLGTKAKVAIPEPKNLKFSSLRTWLEKNTEKIGEALNILYSTKPAEITAVYEHIADIFFFHVDRGDVSPDLKGKIGKLGPSDPNKMRLKSDCDVLATYATRMLKGSGFTPIGYMAIVPDVGVGHAVALLQHGADYYIVNNKEVSKVSAKDKATAIVKLRNDGLNVWDDIESYKVFYADADADGGMLKALRDTEASTRRKDLEPKP